MTLLTSVVSRTTYLDVWGHSISTCDAWVSSNLWGLLQAEINQLSIQMMSLQSTGVKWNTFSIGRH
jgi:hypothetical protein